MNPPTTSHALWVSKSIRAVRPSLPSILFSSTTFDLTYLARSYVLSALQDSITVGHLELEDIHGAHAFGRRSPGRTTAHIKVVNESFWMQVLKSGDLGFSEAYMNGDVQIESLKDVMNLWLDNESTMNAGLGSLLSRFSSTFTGLSNALFGQSLEMSRLNVIASYDQSNELFQAFLSKDMMYSCALWSESEGGVRGDLQPYSGRAIGYDLESAQLRKIRHVLLKARLRTGQKVLEFGTGWGSLAIEAAKVYGCYVETLTLSAEQKKLADRRIKEAGLEDRVTVHLMDYRQLPPEFEKSFDAFISIEMLEHVGAKYYNTYFKIVDWALKSSDATIVISSSTFPESRFSPYQAQDFMRKYMWPNSCLPSATVLIDAAYTGSHGRFTLDSVENHSAHYARTLREWDRRLQANLTPDTLAAQFPQLKTDVAAFAAFKRKWQYLFAYAGAGFSKGYITCHMLSFIRQGDAPAPCD